MAPKRLSFMTFRLHSASRAATLGALLSRADRLGAKDCAPEIDTSEIVVDFQWHVPMDFQWRERRRGVWSRAETRCAEKPRMGDIYTFGLPESILPDFLVNLVSCNIQIYSLGNFCTNLRITVGFIFAHRAIQATVKEH